MYFEIRKLDNGWLVSGNTSYHGGFEFFKKTLTSALNRIAEMKRVSEKYCK